MASQPDGRTLLLDVREHEENIQGSIPSSSNLPLSQMDEALRMEPQDFEVKYGYAKPGMEGAKDIIVYCRSGVRSATAAELLNTFAEAKGRTL